MAQMKFLDNSGLLHLLGKISAWASDTFVKGVKMNGATKARTNGVVDLGTVLTEHQSIRTINGQSLVGEGDLTFQEGLRQVSKSELDGVMMRGIYELIGQIGNDNTEASSLLLVEGSLMGGASQYVIERDGTTHLRHKSPNGSWSDWDRFDRGTLLVHVSHGELAVGEPIDFGLREGQVFEELEDHINLVVICVDDMDLYLFPTIVDFSDDRVEFQSNVMYNNETGTYGTYILGMTLNYPNLIHDEFIFEDIRLSRLKDDSGHRTVSDAEKTAWNGKQAALVSGTNIRTINGESLLGSGDLTIGGLETVDSRNLDNVKTEGIYRASYSGFSDLLVVSSIDGGSEGLRVYQTRISTDGNMWTREYKNGSWTAWQSMTGYYATKAECRAIVTGYAEQNQQT